MKNIMLPLAILMLGVSCTPKQEVDLIVHNANIYTVDNEFSKANTLIIDQGKLVAVGENAELLKNYEALEILDAEGKTIVPGLIDAHCHFYGLGLNQQVVDLVGTQSFEEVLERVQQFYDENPTMIVLLGRGWDQNDWEVQEFPDNGFLSEKFAEIPVVLERVDGHAYLVNQKALNMAGIDESTEVPGGSVIKGPDGKPTGVLVDRPMQLVDAVLPKINRATQIQALQDAQEICFDYGLTTVNDAGLDRSTIELIDSLQQTGDLKHSSVCHGE